MNSFEIKGIEKLQNSIDYILTNYNDDAETILKKCGNNFKKSVVEKTPNGKNKKDESKKLNRGYKVSQVQGYSKDKWVEIRSTSPHFHLIERGHEIYNRQGKPTGKRTQGKFMMKRTAVEFDEKFPKELEKMINDFRKKCKK